MSAARLCPRCLVRLVTSPGAPLGQCPRCGARIQSKSTNPEQLVKTPPGRTGATRQKHATPPPLPAAVASAPSHPEMPSPQPPSVPMHSPPPCSHHGHHAHPPRRKVGRGTRALIATLFSTVLIGGGLALAVYLGDARPTADDRSQDPPTPARTATKPRSARPTANNIPRLLSPEALREKALRAVFQNESASSAKEAKIPQGSHRIDELVLARLKEKDITPAAPCSDAVFVRRIYLDVIGRIPTAAEAKEFLEDTSPNRRQVLIDRLLDHRDYADYWSMKWCDLLRVKSEFPINLWPNAVQAYHRWIRASLRENLPYDQFARALLTSSGSNFRDPPVNFYRAVQSKEPKNLAHAVGLTFMGVRPETWSKERWEGMATFFAQVGYKKTTEWKEEIVLFDPMKPLKADRALFPDETRAMILPDQDPREVFADWLITPKNPWFKRNIANRAWSWLVGRGIIHEPDDIRPDNPPSNPELLAHLERELIEAKYDLKHLFRVILNSKTYQFSSIPASQHTEAANLFAYYPVRRLEAEVLIDAICQISQTTEKYSSPIPEPFTYVPESHRSVSLADASITSAFLEMFGRPPRDTGLESERNNNFTAAQRLHLLNSTHILRKLEQGPGLQPLLQAEIKPRERADRLYLTILSRYPTDDERDAVAEYARSGPWGRRPGLDVAWALINSAEFLCRH